MGVTALKLSISKHQVTHRQKLLFQVLDEATIAWFSIARDNFKQITVLLKNVKETASLVSKPPQHSSNPIPEVKAKVDLDQIQV